jgi:hypothetical protein
MRAMRVECKMRAALLAIVIATLLSQPGTACTIPGSLSAKERARADSVFVGHVVRIDHPTQRGDGKTSERAATITFDVLRTNRGRQVQGTIEVYGFSNTCSFPQSPRVTVLTSRLAFSSPIRSSLIRAAATRNG